MRTLADCLKKHGAELDSGYRKDILDAAKVNKKSGYSAFDSEKFAVATVLEDLVAEREDIIAQIPKTNNKQGEKDDLSTPEVGSDNLSEQQSSQKAAINEAAGISDTGSSNAAEIITPATQEQEAAQKAVEFFGNIPSIFKSVNEKLKGVRGFVMGVAGDKTVYINSESDKPLLFAAFHETIHQMKLQFPKLYEKLEKRIKSTGANWDSYLKSREGIEGDVTAHDALVEELIADFAGDQGTSSEFMEMLYKEEPTIFNKIYEILKETLDKLQKSFVGTPYVDNVKDAQKALAEVLREYKKEQIKSEAETADNGVVTGNTIEPGSKSYSKAKRSLFTSASKILYSYTPAKINAAIRGKSLSE